MSPSILLLALLVEGVTCIYPESRVCQFEESRLTANRSAIVSSRIAGNASTANENAKAIETLRISCSEISHMQ